MKAQFFKVLLSIAMLTVLTVVVPVNPGIVYADVSHCGTLAGNETWSAADSVHKVGVGAGCGDVVVPDGVTLTIEAGAIVKFGPSTRLIVQGTLIANGTTSSRIYFTSIKDDTVGGDTNGDGAASSPGPRNWGWLEFDSNSPGTLSHVTIRYSGDDYTYRAAIYVPNYVIPTLNDVDFSCETPNITCERNYANGIELPGGTLAASATLPYVPNVPYLIDDNDLTVPSGTTLTLEPGVILKFRASRRLIVNGTLNAVGTPTNRIYFTSSRDDLEIDTNADGAASSPGPRNWGWLELRSSSSVALSRATVRYGGDDGSYHGAIYVIGASPVISQSVSAFNHTGIETQNNATPVLICNDIYDNTNYGLYNNTPGITVTAEYHWWGDASGPYHPTLNPSGTGDRVSDGVDFHPWRTTSCISSRLEASKVADKTLVKPSDVLTYTVVAKETSGNPALDASISDPIPANTTYVNGSAQTEPLGTGVLTPTASTIQWSGPVAANSSVTLTFRVNVTTSLSSDTTVVNTATIGDGQGGSFTRAATTTIDVRPPTSTITAPVAGQILSGTTYIIRGIASDSSSGVAQVEVSTDGGASWQAATGTTDWIYTWTLPADGVYTLTSRATDHVGHVQTPDPGFAVTVDNTPPTSTIASPTNGQVITATVYTISGSAADNLSGVDKVEVSTNGGSTWSQASGTTAWSYLWSMPGEDNVTHVLKSHARDQAGNLESTGVVTVTVDNVRPTSVIIDPVEGQILTGTTYLVVGTASDGSGIAKVEVSTDGGANWQAAVGTTNWVYTWTLSVTGPYTVRTRATDGAQNVEEPGPGVTVEVGQSPEADFLIYLPIILKNR